MTARNKTMNTQEPAHGQALAAVPCSPLDLSEIELSDCDGCVALQVANLALRKDVVRLYDDNQFLIHVLRDIYNTSIFDWDTMPEAARRDFPKVIRRLADEAISVANDQALSRLGRQWDGLNGSGSHYKYTSKATEPQSLRGALGSRWFFAW